MDKTRKLIRECISAGKNKRPTWRRSRVGIGSSMTDFLFKDLDRLKDQNNLLSSELVYQTNTILKKNSQNQVAIEWQIKEGIGFKKQIINVRIAVLDMVYRGL